MPFVCHDQAYHIAYYFLSLQLREVEASVDKLELENRQLKTLSTSYQDQVEEANSKIKQLQDSMNDTASDEMASLLRDLNEATSLRVSDGVDRPKM